VTFTITQQEPTYNFLTTVAIETADRVYYDAVHAWGRKSEVAVNVPSRPIRAVFNAANDIPVRRTRYYTMSNFIDDFYSSIMIYGTKRQIEANHTLAENFRTILADTYVEILVPLRKDCEVTDDELSSKDLIVVGGADDNGFVARMAEENKLPLAFDKNVFRWQERTYADPDDGLMIVLPNPYNGKKVLYLFVANSKLQLHYMTKSYRRSMPAWALFKGEEIVDQGYHEVGRFSFRLVQ
jgi:hypothetical protein